MKHLFFRTPVVCLLAALLMSATPLGAQAPAGAGRALTIVSAAPDGEVASLAEANEIRVVFSEPMVTLGRIPAVVRAPFVRITPAIAGSFRWSGHDDPDLHAGAEAAAAATPRGTRSRSIRPRRRSAGGSWREPYTFSFTTPTVKLLRTDAGIAGADAPMRRTSC